MTDAELFALRDALAFVREESAHERAARLHPIACTRPERERACSLPRYAMRRR